MNRLAYFSLCVLACCMLAVSSGCCRRACNGYAASPTIAPPATYSLQIPSANGQPAYYVPGGQNPTATANLPSYLVDPSRRAPTPATGGGTQSVNGQNGWRPVGDNTLSNRSQIPSGGSILASNSTVGSRVAAPPNVAVAQASAQRQQVQPPPQARSVVSSIDYATTQTDERRDSTRLPVTDATRVSAPAGFVNNGTAARLAQAAPPAINYPATYNQTATYAQPATPFFVGTPVVAQTQRPPQFQAQPQFQGQIQTQPGAFQPGNFYYANPVVGSSNQVLAQSTASGIPSGSSSGGWRDRELTASRGELNR